MKYKVLSKFQIMLKLSFKIWVLANVTLAAVFLIATGPGVALQVVFFSSLFSLPAAGLMYLLLQGLSRLRSGVAVSWALTLAATGCIAAVPCLLLNLLFGGFDTAFEFVLPMAAVSAYAAVVFVSPTLHELFLEIRYATED